MTNANMTDPGLPDPGLGRNPPRYRSIYPPWSTGAIVGIVLATFLAVGGMYLFLSSTPITTIAERTTSQVIR